MRLELDLGKFSKKLINSKKLIFLTVTIFSILSLVLSFLPKDLYTSKALLKTNIENNQQLLTTGFGSLLGGYGADSSVEEYVIEVLRSKDFLLYLISDEDIRNQFIDIGNPLFRSSFSGEKEEINEQIYTIYSDILLNVFIQSNGFISMSFSHSTPEKSKIMLQEIISKFNMKERDKKVEEFAKSSERIYEILNTEMTLDSRELYTELFTNKLANTLSEKANIDPMVSYVYMPVIPIKRSFPSKSQFLIIGIVLGFFSSLVLIFFSKEN